MSDRTDSTPASSRGTRSAVTDHDACIADLSLAGHVRGYIDSEVGEEDQFAWGLADLDANDLFHLRKAIQAHFRKVASADVTDAQSMQWHVETIRRVGLLVAAIEAVETANGEHNKRQVQWRQAEWNRNYREEQARLRQRAAASDAMLPETHAANNGGQDG